MPERLNALYTLKLTEQVGTTLQAGPSVDLFDPNGPIVVGMQPVPVYKTMIFGYGFLPDGRVKFLELTDRNNLEITQEGDYQIDGTVVRVKWNNGQGTEGVLESDSKQFRHISGRIFRYEQPADTTQPPILLATAKPAAQAQPASPPPRQAPPPPPAPKAQAAQPATPPPKPAAKPKKANAASILGNALLTGGVLVAAAAAALIAEKAKKNDSGKP